MEGLVPFEGFGASHSMASMYGNLRMVRLQDERMGIPQPMTVAQLRLTPASLYLLRKVRKRILPPE